MDRKAFLTHSAVLGAALSLGYPAAARTRAAAATPGVGATRGAGSIDGARLHADLDALRRFGGTPDGGTHRVAYSDEDLGAREWVLGLMRDAGLDAHIDIAGNLVGEMPGTDPSLPPIAIGSHIDTVPFGGSFDGTIGSLGAIEIVRTLTDEGRRLRHPLRVYVFQNEEGGKTGSRLLIGAVEPHELELPTASGFTIADGLRRIGGNPDDLGAARMAAGDIAAFLERHIELGATLERRGVPIGVVEGIVGIRRWMVTVRGEKNHAGTTPMPARRDALVAASRLVLAANEIALGIEGAQVATVGRMEVEPGAPNVIPETARFTLEVRDLTMEGIDRVHDLVRARAAEISGDGRIEVDFDPIYLSEAAPSTESIRHLTERAADALGLSRMRLPSGAGHDAQSMAKLAPMGMVFVPSRGGISHAPEEYTEAAQITAGVDVLLGTLSAVDETL